MTTAFKSIYLCTLVLILAFSTHSVSAQNIKRVEPLNWWVGMKTPLQLMFNGDSIGNASVRSLNKDLIIKKVTKADSPNYLFVDVTISPLAKAGIYSFEFTVNKKRIRYDYQLLNRRLGSAQRTGFSSADLMYLIMPDRFANGDPGNDSSPLTLEKADKNDEKGRHGGDIQGVIDHLDYLQELGVTALWSTPLLLDNQPKMSYHGYACSDYYQTDPRYGSNDLYKEMVNRAHQHGIKIIMDFVPNHCGTAHWWMKDLPFHSWLNPKGSYTRSFHAIGAISDTNGSQFDRNDVVKTWFSDSMPDMNMENPFVVQYFIQAAIWWIEWSDLDGFRVDTYPYLDKNNMAKWAKTITNEYPHFNIVGECWRSYPALTAYWQQGQHINQDGFNSYLPSVMDFPLTSVLETENQPFKDKLMKVYDNLSQDFLYTNPHNLLIFADNHDMTRIASHLKGNVKELKLVMTLLATLRGMPQLYYGTEVLYQGERSKTGDSQRTDFSGGWKTDQINLFDATQRSSEQNDFFNYTKNLFSWRKTATPVHLGKTLQFKPNKDLYVYFRYTDSQCVMVIINGSDNDANLDWDTYKEMTTSLSNGTDPFSKEKITVNNPLTIKAKSSKIIEFTKNH